MNWFTSAAGAGLVLAALRDVFHTLWHPTARGSLSALVLHGSWRVSRRVGRRGRLTSVVGPAAMVAVILAWTSMVVAGWTLIYWAHLPEGFSFGPGLRPDQRADLLDALYLSLVSLTTLGFGDIVPTDAWLRIAVPVQALIGFALLTAAVSWVGQTYPALARRRVLALRLASLRTARETTGPVDAAFTATVLEDLAVQVGQVRVDLNQHAETYYFQDDDDSPSLPAMISYAMDLAAEGRQSRRDDVRMSAAMLAHALESLATILGRQFLRTQGDPEQIFAAYARDHDRLPVRAR
ncbi:potassium channel family protein [Streptomyces ziwulingensis]